jgi:hypothetical protein
VFWLFSFLFIHVSHIFRIQADTSHLLRIPTLKHFNGTRNENENPINQLMKGEALFCFPDFIEKEKCYYDNGSRLCGVVVSVLATGPKVCGIEPGQGD